MTTAERGDIIEIELTRVRPRRQLWHRPGQFIYISFDADSVSAEPHPFSVSSPPGEPHLRISVKELGDWTSELGALEGGERARIWGPYGKFGDHATADPELAPVLIAGGIGVTPFLSMVADEQFLHETDQTTYLIYSVERADEAIYHDDIESLHLDRFVYVPHCSDDEGFLDAKAIAGKVGGLDGKTFLVCGPAPMMESITEDLREHGVDIERNATEDFSVI